MDDRVAAVVGPAVQAGVEQGGGEEPVQDPFGFVVGERLLGCLVLDQFDAVEEALPAHVADHRQVGEPGAFYLPTLIADVAEDAEIYRDEVFGPVLTVSRHSGDDDAIRRANDTDYGLAASAWTTNLFRAQRASRDIDAGCVWINDHIPIISEMPHGRVGASGFGKDMSTYSFEEYLTVKHVMSDITGVSRKAWHRTVFSAGR